MCLKNHYCFRKISIFLFENVLLYFLYFLIVFFCVFCKVCVLILLLLYFLFKLLSLWRSYGIIVTISTADITNKDGCRQLIHEAKQLGKVTAVFNLAVVLKDGVFENQTRETFEESFGPKAVATKHLDEVTRECCPYLR